MLKMTLDGRTSKLAACGSFSRPRGNDALEWEL
jgi:hypothetical protein